MILKSCVIDPITNEHWITVWGIETQPLPIGPGVKLYLEGEYWEVLERRGDELRISRWPEEDADG